MATTATASKSFVAPASVYQAYADASLDAPSGELTPEQKELLIEHLPMVRYQARRIHERLPPYVELDDLVSTGTVGLIDAVIRFNPEQGVKFSTYAQHRVRGAILDGLRSLDWGPRHLRRKGREIERAIETLETRLGRSPEDTEIAAEASLGIGEYHQLLSELNFLDLGSLHVAKHDESGEEVLAYVEDPAEDPQRLCVRADIEAKLKEAIAGLPERERLVITLYYYEEMTMREIALTLGVVESRISQLRSSAVLRLRSALGRPNTPRPGRGS